MDSNILFSYNKADLDAPAIDEVDDAESNFNFDSDVESNFSEDEAALLEGSHRHDDALASLPEYACSYCGIHNPTSVIRCDTCNKWFCNGKGSSNSSHIVTHLVMSKHNTVSLHEDSDIGDTPLECYNCGNRNVFVLGFVTAKAEHVMVILCRIPCSQTKDPRWDTAEWTSLIENRQFLSWIAPPPTQEESSHARVIKNAQIAKLESQWKLNKDATLVDIEQDKEEVEVKKAMLRYRDSYEYQRTYGPLVQLEAEHDKQLKESQGLEHISVKWSMALNNKNLASFTLSTFESSGMKVAVGDEVLLHYEGYNRAPWKSTGYVIRIPNSRTEEFTVELTARDKNVPTDCTTGFRAEFVWKGTSYERQQLAMRRFASVQETVSSYIYHKLLGLDVQETEFDIKLPSRISIPGYPALNESQVKAVQSVLKKPLSLIQGPPGTGKTVTSATIVYHLTKLSNNKILVCAPSNVATDHLASKLDEIGIKVVRLRAKSREDVECAVEHLALDTLVSKTATGKLKKFLALKDDIGELNSQDQKEMIKLLRKKEKSILKSAQVVCTTCVGAGDMRLHGMQFTSVLIDETTQASEPECMIPIAHGARQVILVGDHQQMGPIIMDKRAAEAGLKLSLFERMIMLDHVPIRLQVQYRMNPCLSEFSSNMFYEGMLQNGVSKEERSIASSTFPWPVSDTPMMFWANVGREEISASGTSFLNRIEAMNCERIVTRLFRDGIKPEQIGIITPYEGQRAFLVQYMTMSGTMDKDLYASIEVASVDAFQGREKDFIIFSCVRSNDQQNIGFLRDYRRLNVALTRAKYGLVILGNPRSFTRDFLWTKLLIHFREKGCLVEGRLDNLQLSVVQLEFANAKLQNKNRGLAQQSQLAGSAKTQSTTTRDHGANPLLSFNTDGDATRSSGIQNAYPSFFTKSNWPLLTDYYNKNGPDEGIDAQSANHGDINENSTIGNEEEDFDPKNVYDPGLQINSSYSNKLEKFQDEKLAQTLKNLNLG